MEYNLVQWSHWNFWASSRSCSVPGSKLSFPSTFPTPWSFPTFSITSLHISPSFKKGEQALRITLSAWIWLSSQTRVTSEKVFLLPEFSKGDTYVRRHKFSGELHDTQLSLLNIPILITFFYIPAISLTIELFSVCLNMCVWLGSAPLRPLPPNAENSNLQ